MTVYINEGACKRDQSGTGTVHKHSAPCMLLPNSRLTKETSSDSDDFFSQIIQTLEMNHDLNAAISLAQDASPHWSSPLAVAGPVHLSDPAPGQTVAAVLFAIDYRDMVPVP